MSRGTFNIIQYFNKAEAKFYEKVILAVYTIDFGNIVVG